MHYTVSRVNGDSYEVGKMLIGAGTVWDVWDSSHTDFVACGTSMHSSHTDFYSISAF